MDIRQLPGTANELGATWGPGKGTNFALFSENATRVDLCLFDEQGNETRYPLNRGVITLSGIAICWALGRGSSMVFECMAPTSPQNGHRFNPHKLLI